VPSLSTLVDNFNDSIIGANWGNSYGSVTESSGKAHVPCTTGFAGYQTAYSWTLAGASFYVAVTTTPAASTATEAYASVFVNAPDIATSGTRIGFVINKVTGLLKFSSEVAYFDAGATTVTYNSTTHKFLRLREDGTNVYWDTSSDGSTWTNRRTLATPAWVTASVDTCALDLSAHRDAGTSDEAAFDLFNTLADGAVFTASATLTSDSTLTAAARLGARVTADLTADSTLTATAWQSMHATATLGAETDLTADADSGSIPEVADMAAGDWDLRIEQGSTFLQTYTVTDAGFSWDGWAARAQIRSAPADHGDLLLDLTPYLMVAGAEVRLAIPATQTQALTRNGVWDLEMVLGSTVVRILAGRMILSREVTR
jgi:cytochrome c5